MKIVDFDEKIKNVKDKLAVIAPQSKVMKPSYEVDAVKLKLGLQLIANELIAVKKGKSETTSNILTVYIVTSLKNFRNDPTPISQKNFLVATNQGLGAETAEQFEEWLKDVFKEQS